LLGLADSTGAFELFFYRLTRRDALRRFYARQVFLEGAEVPHKLVNYAFLTAHVRGAHYAPRRFIDGTLFLGLQAQHAYTRLQRPTLIIAPEQDGGLIQSFELLDDIAAGNDTILQVHRMSTGLLPQWEAPEALFERLDAFLA
jgi:pimeloyl-ACP methyl ester carboxylesterase